LDHVDQGEEAVMPEPRLYTAGEKAKLTALAARAAVVVARGRSTAAVDRAIEQIQAEACAREAAEDAARAKAAQARIDARAAQRAARRLW
jgi:hypothetical protein